MRNGIKKWVVPIIAVLFLAAAVWGDDAALVEIQNQFLKIMVNNAAEMGRFAVDTTGGDPDRKDDDNKPLIYGHPKPWTSFTTVRIDNQNFVFGKATPKRAGAGLPGGEMLETPHRDGNKIVTRCRYNKTITVEQTLDITESSGAGAADTARIQYVCENRGDQPAEVGLRVLLDTMLSANDGAPFRVRNKEITMDYDLERDEMPDFWQAFDSLENPAVIAQSTLKGGQITPPDRLVFVNWGKAADNPWEFPIANGADFTRLGEDELDSAAVMYWLPRRLNPGERFTVITYYGLGDITFAAGKTFLGISAPAEVEYQKYATRKYSVVLYLEHHGKKTARNVKVRLELPFGITCVSGNSTVKIKRLRPGDTKQFSWEIKPNGAYLGDTGFQIHVSGKGLKANQVLRKIRIIGPAVLTGKLIVPRLKTVAGRWTPNPLRIRLEVENIGQSIAYDVAAVLECQDGFRFPDGEERMEKYLKELKAGQSDVVDWKLTPIANDTTGRFQVRIHGLGLNPLRIPAQVPIPPLPLRVSMRGPGTLQSGQVFSCDVVAQNLNDIKKFSLTLRYNPKQLCLISVSRGLFAIENNSLTRWSGGTGDAAKGVVTDITADRKIPYRGDSVSLAQLNFIVVEPGQGEVELEAVHLVNSLGENVPLKGRNLKYSITNVQP